MSDLDSGAGGRIAGAPPITRGSPDLSPAETEQMRRTEDPCKLCCPCRQENKTAGTETRGMLRGRCEEVSQISASVMVCLFEARGRMEVSQGQIR